MRQVSYLFKSISGETFKEALRLTQDLAEVGFGDVKQGAIQLGKALEEPIVGLGALRKLVYLLQINKRNKSFVMTGQKAEAENYITSSR